MPALPITFIKGDNVGSETDYRDSLPINMVAIIKPLFSAAGYMLQAPGLTKLGDTTGKSRGGIWNERFQKHLRVDGSTLVSVDSDGSITEIGTIPGADTVSLPYSFNTQGIVADGKFFLYDETNGLREVTDSDLGNPIDCVWIDNYYFFTDGENLYHTDITSEESIDSLQFATSEFSPDPTLGVAKTSDNKVIVFNRYTTEYFVNTASDDFAFQRQPSRAVKMGIVGTHCKAEMSDGWYVMGNRKEEAVGIHAMGVGSANRVSTREVEKVINKYTEDELSKSVLEARVEDGYNYLLVHLPKETLMFNENIARTSGVDSAWTILATGRQQNYRAIHGVFDVRLGKWVYGDKNEPVLGILDEKQALHYDVETEWQMSTPFLFIENTSVTKFEIECLPGFNATDDRTVYMSLTYDGVTITRERPRDYGMRNEYGKRFIIRRLGYVRDWFAIRLRGFNSSRVAFARAFIEYE